MAAGIIIPCMGTTTVVYRHIEGPIKSSLTKCATWLRRIVTLFPSAYPPKETDSTAELQLEQRNNYNAPHEPSMTIERDRPVPDRYMPRSPPTRVASYTQIRKITEVVVVQGLER